MRYTLTFFLGLLLSSCLVVNTSYEKLPPGTYRGVFLLDGKHSQRVEPDEIAANFNLKDVQKGELPFNFELSYKEDSSMMITVINGAERLEFTDIHFERLFDKARDSITIRTPLNDAYITGYHEDGIIEGTYIDETRENGSYSIPFVANFGVGYRFTDLRKTPIEDLSGRWEVTFSVENEQESYPAIAEFRQEGNDLFGTFLTTTGDYRYLHGTVQEGRAYLSTFDGGHIFLFTAKLQEDGSLLGIFRSGKHYQTIWSANRNDKATLPDPSQESKVIDEDNPIEIVGISADGKSFNTNTLTGDIKVLSLFGTWCPNCKDESLFLDSLKHTLPSDRISFTGLAFERVRDTAKALIAMRRFSERLDLSYPLVLIGNDDKAEATSKLGFLDRVRSFPTIVVLDKDNRVRYTHTGFSGPATSEYGTFTRAFTKTLETLLAE